MHNVPEYYALLERIGWRLSEFDFDAIDVENVSDQDRVKIRETGLIEGGIPHYIDLWSAVDGFWDEWELRQFNLIWSSEEFRHSEGLRLLGEKVSVNLDAELGTVKQTEFVKNRNASCPSGCYATIGGMLTYTTLQELVTWKFYQKWAKVTQSDFIKRLLAKISADEMRHHQWFANALQRYLGRVKDPDAYRRHVVDAVVNFHMPQMFYSLEFPYINDHMPDYFSADDINQIKSKVVKILAFDPQILVMLMQVGEDSLTKSFSAVPQPAAE